MSRRVMRGVSVVMKDRASMVRRPLDGAGHDHDQGGGSHECAKSFRRRSL